MYKAINQSLLITGMPKRPMGFPNPNFVQGQVSANTPGTPGGGPSQQLQSSQGMTHTGNFFNGANKKTFNILKD